VRFLRLGIIYMRGDGVGAGRNVVRVDTSGRIFAIDLASIRAPAIGNGVLRIEVAGIYRRGEGLAHHDFSRLHRAGSDGCYGRCASPTQNHAGTEPDALLFRTPQVRELGGGQIRKMMCCPNVVRFKYPDCKLLRERKVPPAADDYADGVRSIGYVCNGQTVVAHQSVQEKVRTLGPPHEAWSTRYGGVVIATGPIVSKVQFHTPM